MKGLLKLTSSPILQKRIWNKYLPCRTISTSKKNKTDCPTDEPITKTTCHVDVKNWVSYGFNYENEKEDTNAHHASFFFSVTLCLVFGTFVWAYAPDVHMRDWAQREAFLILRTREKFGLAAISPHFVDPGTINLPDEDDLCEVPIII